MSQLRRPCAFHPSMQRRMVRAPGVSEILDSSASRAVMSRPLPACTWLFRRRGNRLRDSRSFRLLDRIESVRERDLREMTRRLVLEDGRIDEEAHRHVDGLARLEPLLRKAEALDLVEVAARDLRRHVEGRRSRDRTVGRVLRAIKRQRVLAYLHVLRLLDRVECPAESRCNIGVETDSDDPV